VRPPFASYFHMSVEPIHLNTMLQSPKTQEGCVENPKAQTPQKARKETPLSPEVTARIRHVDAVGSVSHILPFYSIWHAPCAFYRAKW
jgi:hypothetical protein